MVWYGAKITQNMKILQNNQIFKYIPIFWTNIFIRKNIRWFFPDRIILDFHCWSFYHAEYILIFICPISMVMNIFEYSFVPKNDIRPTLVHLSICLFVDVFICSLVHLSIYPFVHLSICPFVHLSLCPFLNFFVRPFVHLSICSFVL